MRFLIRVELPQWLILAGMFVASLVAWPSVSDRVPVHWGLNGEVDRYGGKFEGLLLLPPIAMGTWALLGLLPRIDPGRANYAAFAWTYRVIRIATLLLFAVIHGMVIAAASGARSCDPCATARIGLRVHRHRPRDGQGPPKLVRRHRTPWTLSSRRSWTRTHRFGGWLFIGIGLVAISSLGFPASWLPPILVTLGVGGTIAMFGYSYVEWRNDSDRSSPETSVS